VLDDRAHEASVNSVAWAPHVFGLCLAAASADGTVSVFSYRADKTWDVQRFAAHAGMCYPVFLFDSALFCPFVSFITCLVCLATSP
jgi:protein transport protein SEC13